MSLQNISEEEWIELAKQHDMSVEDLKIAVEAQLADESGHGHGGCGCGHDHGHDHGHSHGHQVELRKFEDFTEEELIEGAKYNNMELEEFKVALKEHLEDLANDEASGNSAEHSIEDFSEEELIQGAKENGMELEEYKQALIEYLAHHNGGGCCGGHGDDDHECCGGHGHEDGSECCGGEGHEDGSECCSSDKPEKKEKSGGCGCH